MINSYLNPQIETSWNFSIALEALKKERIAHIVRIAEFIFANIITIAAIALTEAEVVVWPIALPVVLIMAAAWMIFFRMKSWVDTFSQGLDEKRAEIVKQEFQRLLKLKLNEFSSNEQLIKPIEDLNHILGMSFDPLFIQKLLILKEKSSPDKTLLEAASEYQVDLSFNCDQKIQYRGWFGEPGIEYHLEASWTGKPEDEPRFKFTRQMTGPQEEMQEN